MSRIREEYVANGQVRFVYKNFAILGQESSRSAEASECAAEQDKFWEFHDAIFADQSQVNSRLDDDWLIGLADELAMDVDSFSECLTSGRYAAQISQEALSIQSLGVRGTPGFVVNGVYIAGAQPFEVFAQVIDQQLAALGYEVEERDLETQPENSQPAGPQPAGPPPPSNSG